MKKVYSGLAIWFLLFTASNLWADGADVVGVKIRRSAPQTYVFDVTVRHADTGWDHYADQWEVLSPDETVLGTRVLYHPHVDEQPFTRSLSGVKIPSQVKQVTIRAHDKVHGWTGKTMTMAVPGP